MCEWGNTVKVWLCRPQRGSYIASVDSCLAPLVQALNNAGIETIASCCGHGHLTGSIILRDNRVLEIHDFFNVWIEEQNRTNKVNIHGERKTDMNDLVSLADLDYNEDDNTFVMIPDGKRMTSEDMKRIGQTCRGIPQC